MARSALLAVLAMVAVTGAYAQAAGAAQPGALLTIQFDNRGSKVMSPATEKKITEALAKHVFMVPVGKVARTTGLGQSSLINHQSVVTYQATGPTTNGKTPLQNCEANTKGGLFSSSTAAKELKKATDTWAVGDSVKVQSAVCAPIGGAPAKPVAAPAKPAGRKMVL